MIASDPAQRHVKSPLLVLTGERQLCVDGISEVATRIGR
jgi:hypothetical protein